MNYNFINLFKMIAYFGLLFSIFMSLLLVYQVEAETIIYDNFTTSNYKQIRITDDINLKYFNEYSYDVYINNSYLGTYKKDELITIPDNSDITIYVPNNIKTNFEDTASSFKTYIYIAVLSLFSIIIILIIAFIGIKKLMRG